MGAVCCLYWLFNSCLGIYVLLKYPRLQEQNELLYQYIIIFSAKWLFAFLITIVVLLAACLLQRLFYSHFNICSNLIGAFPLVYFFLIAISYIYALKYVIQIYQTAKEEDSLGDIPSEAKVFLINEAIMGLIIISQCLLAFCCGKLEISPHLEEIAPEAFMVDEEEIKQAEEEINRSKKMSEMRAREKQFASAVPKEHVLNELVDIEKQDRESSPDPRILNQD